TTNRGLTLGASGGTLFPGIRMTFAGAGSDTFSADLVVDDEGGIVFARTGGTTTITPGARLVGISLDNTVELGGTRDVLTDGSNFVDVATPANVTIDAGTGKNTGVLDSSSTNPNTTTLSGGVTA